VVYDSAMTAINPLVAASRNVQVDAFIVMESE
jgi:hypothetical protein